MEKLKKRIQKITRKRPGYREILDFYQQIRKKQEMVKAAIKIKTPFSTSEWKEVLAQKGFPLLEKKVFPLDMEAMLVLFKSLCQIGREANPYMAVQVEKIEDGLNKKRFNFQEMFKEGFLESKIEHAAKELGCDKNVFFFLLYSSMNPFAEAEIDQLPTELTTDLWLQGYCPICGSLPYLSLLKEEANKRFLFCSCCGYRWQTERLSCPFCSNRNQESLLYLYAEGEELCRIDLCEKCHRYIKTLDWSEMEAPDPVFEDLTTLHLDMLAYQKGYKRPTFFPWIA